MGQTVFVGCKLPNGITLEHPMDPERKKTLRGINQARTVDGQGRIVEQAHAVTQIDAEFWAAWKATHYKKFPAVLSGAIFEAESTLDLDAISREFAGRKTGFDRMPQDTGRDVEVNSKTMGSGVVGIEAATQSDT